MWVLILTAYIFMTQTPETHSIPLPSKEMCEQARVDIVATQPLLSSVVLIGKCEERKP